MEPATTGSSEVTAGTLVAVQCRHATALPSRRKSLGKGVCDAVTAVTVPCRPGRVAGEFPTSRLVRQVSVSRPSERRRQGLAQVETSPSLRPVKHSLSGQCQLLSWGSEQPVPLFPVPSHGRSWYLGGFQATSTNRDSDPPVQVLGKGLVPWASQLSRTTWSGWSLRFLNLFRDPFRDFEWTVRGPRGVRARARRRFQYRRDGSSWVLGRTGSSGLPNRCSGSGLVRGLVVRCLPKAERHGAGDSNQDGSSSQLFSFGGSSLRIRTWSDESA